MDRPIGSFRHQRGAVVVIVALSIALLLGMIGLAIDLGRMFVIKTELQNAADACALAAAKELDGNSGAKLRADAAGTLVGPRNEVNFQDEGAAITTANLSYSDVLSPNSNYNRTISDTAARYVMCTVSKPSIGMLFMGVLGLGPQNVSAYAVAGLGGGQTTCAVPLGICAASPSDPPSDPADAEAFGLIRGQWYAGKFGSGSGETLTGSYNWIDFEPQGGGANEIRDLLGGPGQCELPPVGTCVGEQGQISAASDAWNTRFGLYKGAYSFPDNQPDHTGWAYTYVCGTTPCTEGATATTWPSRNDAYGQSINPDTCAAGDRHYVCASKLGAAPPPYAYSGHSPSDPADVGYPNPYSGITAAQHRSSGGQRRIATSPVVDCSLFSGATSCGSQRVPILGYACVLMLSPIRGPNGVVLEYLGQPGAAGVPCASYGIPGGSGPPVPGLVQ